MISKIINGEGASEGLTIKKWEEMKQNGVIEDSAEVYRLTYYGGVDQEIRKEVIILNMLYFYKLYIDCQKCYIS